MGRKCGSMTVVINALFSNFISELEKAGEVENERKSSNIKITRDIKKPSCVEIRKK